MEQATKGKSGRGKGGEEHGIGRSEEGRDGKGKSDRGGAGGLGICIIPPDRSRATETVTTTRIRRRRTAFRGIADPEASLTFLAVTSFAFTPFILP